MDNEDVLGIPVHSAEPSQDPGNTNSRLKYNQTYYPLTEATLAVDSLGNRYTASQKLKPNGEVEDQISVLNFYNRVAYDEFDWKHTKVFIGSDGEVLHLHVNVFEPITKPISDHTVTSSRYTYIVNEQYISFARTSDGGTYIFEAPEEINWAAWIDDEHILIDTWRITLVYHVPKWSIVCIQINTSDSRSMYEAQRDIYMSASEIKYALTNQNYLLISDFEEGSFDYWDEDRPHNPWRTVTRRDAMRIYSIKETKRLPHLEDFRWNDISLFDVSEKSDEVFIVPGLRGDELSCRSLRNGVYSDSYNTDTRDILGYGLIGAQERFEKVCLLENLDRVLVLTQDNRLQVYPAYSDFNDGPIELDIELNSKCTDMSYDPSSQEVVVVMEDSILELKVG